MHHNKLKNTNIYLTGFMGCGKTTVGRLLAEKLDLKFIDADDEIEQRTGMTIPAVFEDQGESGFRGLESDVLRKISSASGQIVALGGGAVKSKENRKVITETGLSICLHFPAEIIAERLNRDQTRPLLSGLTREGKLARIHEMMQERIHLYQTADLFLELSEESPEEICEIILESIGINI